MLNVLVPLDGSANAERALACGRALASGLGGELVVVASGPTNDRDYETLADYIHNLQLPEPAHREILPRVGPAKAIDTVARRHAPCLVCMTARGRGARTSAVLGSVTTQVLTQGAGPILVVGPAVDWTARTHCDSLLVALTASEDSLMVLEPATQLAAALATNVEFVTFARDTADIATVRATTEARLAEAGLGTTTVEDLVAHHPANALIDRAEQRPGTVLAIAAEGRTRTQKFLLGSLATTLISHAPAPVLAVPPHRPARPWRDWRLTS